MTFAVFCLYFCIVVVFIDFKPSGTPNLFTHAAGGILVAAVDPSSSAASAGLAAGDVVTGISGSNVSVMTHADALRVLQVMPRFSLF